MQSPAGLYGRIREFIFGHLWREDLDSVNRGTALGYRTARVLVVLAREFSSGQLNLRAMSLVYTTLLSLVPLLAVSFSVLKAFGVHNQIEPMLLNLVEPLGAKGEELAQNVLGFVENVKVGVLGSLGLALLLYTVVSLIQKVEDAFNYVWHAKSARPFSRRFSDYLSVIMVGPVLVFSALGLTASMMSSRAMQAVISIEPFGTLLLVVTKLVPFLLIVMAFCFVYVFIPNTRVKFSAALGGALVGGALWQATGLIFAEFASSSTKYDAIYSGFAILVLFMIWLYLNWLILLIGAQVAYYFQYPEQVRLSNQRVPLRGRFREQMGLLVMYWITHRFVHDGQAMTLEQLAEVLHLPGERVMEILEMLTERGLVTESASTPPEFLLLHDPASLLLAELVETIRRPDSDYETMEHRVHSAAPVDELMVSMDSAVRENLAERTLRDLVLSGAVVE